MLGVHRYYVGFLSTPSARRATSASLPLLQIQTYFYPRPPRGGRLRLLGRFVVFEQISIHALREEGDRARRPRHRGGEAISIHALREEGDARMLAIGGRIAYFYPRPPRGGRRRSRGSPSCQRNFYPRPPRGGRPPRRLQMCRLSDFYPRPPRGGRLYNKAGFPLCV